MKLEPLIVFLAIIIIGIPVIYGCMWLTELGYRRGIDREFPSFEIGMGVIVDYDESNNTFYANAKPRKTTFENIDYLAKWPCEPTVPAVGYLRLKIYEKWESLYLNPKVIDSIKDCEQYTSITDGALHAPHTSVTTVHGFTYSVEESSEYIIKQAKLLWDGFNIVARN